MIRSKQMLASAALTVLGLGVATMALTPSDGSARGAPAHGDLATVRIAAAFALSPVAEPAPAVQAAARRAAKGDRLGSADCVGGNWPEVTSACLVRVDGSTIRTVRSVTIGDAGAATTVLLRMPAPQVASR